MEGLGRRKKIRESKPSFIVKPRRQFTDEGATAKFKASFDGEPPPTLKWELNSQEVTNGGRFSVTERGDFHILQISDVTLEDKGKVTCTISNKLDTLSASADLDVFARPDARRTRREKKEVKPPEETKVAPKVEKALEDQEVDDGGVATLECTFTGTPEPTAAWRHNGKPLQPSNDIKQSFNGRMAKLFFREVYPEDEGTYICTATNSEGEVSTTAQLKVKVTVPADVAPTFTRPLSDVTVNDEDHLTLACEVTAMPDPEIKWYKNGKLLKASRDFKPSFDGRTASLEIVEVYVEDEGKYECEAKNVAGEAKTSAILTVIELPHSEEEQEEEAPTPVAPPEVAPVSPPVIEKPPEEMKLVSPPSIRAGPRKVSPPPVAVTDPVTAMTSPPSPLQVAPPSPLQVAPPSPVKVSSPLQVAPPVEVAPPAEKTAPSTEQRSKMKVETTRLIKDRNDSATNRVPLGINVTKVKPVTLEVLHAATEDDQKPRKTSESSKTIESTATLEATKRNETKANEKFVSEVTLCVNSNVKPKLSSEFQLVPSDNVNKESNVTVTGTKVAPLQKSDSLVYQMTLSLNKPKSGGSVGAKTQNAQSWKSSPVRTGVGSVKESPFKQSEAAGKPVASYVKDHKSSTPRKPASSPFAVSYLKSKSPVSQVTASLKSNSAPAHDEHRVQSGRKINKLTPTSWLPKSSESSSSSRKGGAAPTEPEVSTSKKVNPKFAQMQQKFAGSSSSSPTPLKDRSFGSVHSVKKTQLKSDLSVSNSKEKRTPSKLNANTSPETVHTTQVNGSADDVTKATAESTKSSLVVQVTDNSSALVVEPHVTGQTISLVINNDNHEDPISVIPPGVSMTQTSKTEEEFISVKKPASPGIVSEAAVTKTNGTVETNNNTYMQPQPQPQPQKASPPKSTDPPQFVKRLEDQTILDGDQAEFVVEITGAEPMEVCWLHEQQEIQRDSKIFQFISEGNIHKLILAEAYPEDSGMYVCEVYNDYGDEDTTCVLTVTEAQEEPPTAVFSNAPTNNQYSAPDQPDAVAYDGVVEPDPGFFPPEFVKRPKSETVDEGAPAKFMCEVDANPQPKIEWTKNGVLIESDGHFKVWGDGYRFNFEIPRSSAGDAGRYVCTAHNSEGTEKAGVSLVVKATTEASHSSDFRSVLKRSGSKFSQNAPQQEVPDPEHEQHDFRTVLKRHVDTKQRPKVIRELEDITCVEGDTVSLQCQVVGVPPPTISWFVGKKEIKESKYFHMSYEGGVASLAIAELYAEDEGEYTCRATNSAGTVETHSDIFVQENSAEPMVAPDTVSKDHRLSLTLDKDEPPFIEDLSPENVQVLRGTTFQLRGKFAGEPRPHIQWTKEKKELTAGGRVRLEVVRDMATLTISNAECSDTGTYSLTLTNDLGQDSVTSSVTIEDKPERPVGKPSVTNVDSTSVSLSWYGPSYDGGTNVTDYRVEMCNITDHNWRTLTSTCKHTSFNVMGLQPNNEYEFRVSAANKHGFGEPGEVSDPVLTIEQGPIGEEDMLYTTTPLSPAAEKSVRDKSTKEPGEQTFEPRVVMLTPDRKFSDLYVLGKEIGKGRFGSVYTCTEKKLRQRFAAKIIKLRPSQREEKRMEIDIMNQLHHPKLLLLWDAFESQREMTLVMEHIAGGELFERIINSDYILTERECVYFMRQICEAIDFMHSKQILHLDLKPENVLCITPNSNEIKIIDFGLARKFDPDESFKIMFGTPEFVAPEVINYDQVSYGTDMWSIGVICYILLSGLSPFMGDNDNETLVSVTMAQWDFEDDAFDEISSDAKNFIEKLLVKDMRKRQSVREGLQHSWLSQDTTCMRAKRLSTAKHKKFLARRKWQKTGTAIRALGRIGGLQKALNSLGRQAPDSAQTATSGDHSRQDSLNSDSGISCSSGVSERQFHSALRSLRTQLPESELGGVGTTERKSSRRMEGTDSTTIVEETPADVQMEPPRFVQTMTDCEVQVGERATFKVKVIGSPPPVVTWYREGVKVGGTRRCATTSSEDGVHTLTIRRCRQEDDSCYECTAKNTAGEVTCTGDLFVLPSADS